MASDKDPPDNATERAGRNRRPPPTIDLRATEIANEPPAAASTAEATSEAVEPPAAEAPAEATASAAAASADTPAASSGDDSAAERAAAPPPNAGVPPPPPRRGGFRSALGGAVAGGIVALIVAAIAWGLAQSDRGTAVQQQSARIDNLQQSVHDIAARKSTAAVNPETVTALAQRVGKLEAAAKTPAAAPADQALRDRLATMEKSIGGLKDTLAKLQQSDTQAAADLAAVRQRADTAAANAATTQTASAEGSATARKDIDALANRLSAVERSTQAMQSDLAKQQKTIAQQGAELAKQASAESAQRALRLAVVAESLKQTVARGEPYGPELDAAKALAGDKAALAPLESFAASGVPSAQALGRELLGLLPTIRQRADKAANEDAGFLQRLQANAERLVQIRPVNEPAGDDPDSILGRLESRAEHGNIGGALAELDKLPPNVRAPAESWIKKAKARDAALDAGERFAAAALGALAQPSE